MKKIISFLAILVGLLSACSRTSIPLQKLRSGDLPPYFSSAVLFGVDKDEMLKTNSFLIVIGKIDTTDESAPERVAWIKLDNQTRKLTLAEGKTEDLVKLRYTDPDYDLLISYRLTADQPAGYEGSFVLKTKTGQVSERIYGTAGYH